MIKTKVAFLEGRLFSSQSGLFEIALIGWIREADPPKSHFYFDHVNRLRVACRAVWILCIFFKDQYRHEK